MSKAETISVEYETSVECEDKRGVLRAKSSLSIVSGGLLLHILGVGIRAPNHNR